MSSHHHPYDLQLAALAAASVWPLLALGLAAGSRFAEVLPHTVRAKIAGRGPKPTFTAERLKEARASR